MPHGTHFRKPGEDDLPGSKRRWWPLAVAAPIAAGLVVAVVVVALSAGHPSARANQAASSRAADEARAASQSHFVSAPTTASTLPADPYLQPGGSVLPVLVVFDGSTIKVQGAVPSIAIEQRLATLAKAYSTTPNARVVSSLIVDPRVPASTGVRVIEMDAVRFASGSSQITPNYAPQLGRVVTILKTIPKLIVTVIGHADQTGNSVQNLSLSYARAAAVAEYLVSQGINPARLTAQGVGDTSPLTEQSNAAGLALNRRTEFIFYGLMANP